MVKKEQRHGNLDPTVLPMATVAVDGKNVATLRWHHLCQVLKLDETNAQPAEAKELLARQHPDWQFCVPENGLP